MMDNITLIAINAVALIALALWIFSGVSFVETKTYRVVEIFGKFHKIMKPGFNITWPAPISNISRANSLQLIELPIKVETKSKDDIFVEVPMALQYSVMEGKEYEAFYELNNRDAQLESYLKNKAKVDVNKRNVEDIYNDQEAISEEIKIFLKLKFEDFGINIIDVLVDEPILPTLVQASYNNVKASEKNREAASMQGEAEKIILIKKAEGESESLILKAKAHKEMRELIAEGSATSIKTLGDAGISPELSQELFVQIDKMDAIRDAGKNGNVIIMDTSNSSSRASQTLAQQVAAHAAITNKQ